MAIFDGRYRWDGKKTGEQEPIAWSPGAYDVKIFESASPTSKVKHLKPYICIYSPTGEGQSISAHPEKFAKQICRDFSLDLERVLWVEDLMRQDDRYEVVVFSRSAKIGGTVFYSTKKRKAQRGEILLIAEHMAKRCTEGK